MIRFEHHSNNYQLPPLTTDNLSMITIISNHCHNHRPSSMTTTTDHRPPTTLSHHRLQILPSITSIINIHPPHTTPLTTATTTYHPPLTIDATIYDHPQPLNTHHYLWHMLPPSSTTIITVNHTPTTTFNYQLPFLSIALAFKDWSLVQ